MEIPVENTGGLGKSGNLGEGAPRLTLCQGPRATLTWPAWREIQGQFSEQDIRISFINRIKI